MMDAETIRKRLVPLTHVATAFAQVILSGIFIVGYFFVLWLFMSGSVHVPIEYKDAFTAYVGVLTAGVMTVLNYWFSRQRESREAHT